MSDLNGRFGSLLCGSPRWLSVVTGAALVFTLVVTSNVTFTLSIWFVDAASIQKADSSNWEPLDSRGGKLRPIAPMDEDRQAYCCTVEARSEMQRRITRLVKLTTNCAPRAQPTSFQSIDIGLFGSNWLLKKNPLESPSAWQFRSVKNVGPFRVSGSADKSQT